MKLEEARLGGKVRRRDWMPGEYYEIPRADFVAIEYVSSAGRVIAPVCPGHLQVDDFEYVDEPKPQSETEEWPMAILGDTVLVFEPTRGTHRPETVMEARPGRFLYWRFEKDGVVDEHPFAWRAWWCSNCKKFLDYFRSYHGCQRDCKGKVEPTLAKCAVMRKETK